MTNSERAFFIGVAQAAEDLRIPFETAAKIATEQKAAQAWIRDIPGSVAGEGLGALRQLFRSSGSAERQLILNQLRNHPLFSLLRGRPGAPVDRVLPGVPA